MPQIDDARISAVEALRRVRTLRWIAPDDLSRVTATVRAAVEEGRDEVPRWTYANRPPADLARRLRRARTATQHDSTVPDALRTRLTDELDRAEHAIVAATAGDDDEFDAWSRTRHPPPAADLLDGARELLSRPAREPEDAATFSAEDLAHVFEAAIAATGLTGWTVRRDPSLVPGMSVQPLRRVLSIRADGRFGIAAARRLLAHELGTHAFRAANAQDQPEALASVAFGDAVGTEEGLAAWTEARLGVATEATRRVYAARAVGVDLARARGVVQVARALVPAVGVDMAVQTAIRVKRGLRDPNLPGAYAKDQEYLLGLDAVARHLTIAPDDLPLVMATKWPLADLPLARELEAAGRLRTSGRIADRSLLDHVPAASAGGV